MEYPEKQNGEIEELATDQEIKVIDGKKYRRVESGYSIREWYSHETPKKGPGPGWDHRFQLTDSAYAMKKFGRTFTLDEVADPNKLPDEPYYQWRPIEEDE